MIARAEKAYEMYKKKYQDMAAAYPQVLISQRTLAQLEVSYITALENFATSSLSLQSYLLTDGLEAPSQPGGIDRPGRKANIPFQMSASPQKRKANEKTHSSSIDHRCGNRREIPDLRLDRQNPATAAECKRWGSGEHRAPTVSSAQHWYPSSVDQPKIWYVPWTIGCRGVGGGISTDVDREIDSGRFG